MLTMATVPEVFAPLLTRIEADASAHFSGSIHLAPAGGQDRPFSQLLRLAVSRPGETRPFAHLFVKKYKPKPELSAETISRRVVRDYETNRRVHDALKLFDDIGAVPPVACYPELLTIVTEEVPGPTLLEHLHDHAAWVVRTERLGELETIMGRAAHWLQVFQRTASRATVDPYALRDYIDHRLQRLVRSDRARFSDANRARILQHVDALSARIDPQDLNEVAVHSDMALGNVLVSNGRVVVLDFAMAKFGTRLHDLSRLWVQLDVLTTKPRFLRPTVRALQAALLAGYDSKATAESPLFQLLVLLHRVNQLAKLSASSGARQISVYDRVVRWHHRHRLTQQLRTAPGPQ